MSRVLRYLAALNEAIALEMERDEQVFMVGEDIRENLRGETKGLFARFGGERVLDAPISEAAFTGLATGAAMAGMRPIVELQIPSLVYVAFDQIVNQAAKLRLMLGGQVSVPVTYLVMAAGARTGLAGQHSDNPYPLLAHAGVKVVCPGTPYDVKGLTISAIRDDDPVAVIAPAASLGMRGEVPEGSYTIPLGSGVVRREGTDVTLVAVGHVVNIAMDVAQNLEADGIDVEVWDPRSVHPLDIEGLCASVAKTGRLVVAEDANPVCGFAAEIIAVVAERTPTALKASPVRVTRAHIPIPFSGPLETASLVGPAQIADAVRLLLSRQAV